MTNETLEEIRKILRENGEISPEIAARITLATLIDLTTKLDNVLSDQVVMAQRIGDLENRNIVLWVEKHPQLTIVLGIALITLIQAWNTWGPALAKTLGLYP